jgi:hypothetical protein
MHSHSKLLGRTETDDGHSRVTGHSELGPECMNTAGVEHLTERDSLRENFRLW